MSFDSVSNSPACCVAVAVMKQSGKSVNPLWWSFMAVLVVSNSHIGNLSILVSKRRLFTPISILFMGRSLLCDFSASLSAFPTASNRLISLILMSKPRLVIFSNGFSGSPLTLTPTKGSRNVLSMSMFSRVRIVFTEYFLFAR